LDFLRVYGVDVAAFCVLFAVISLGPAARGYRRSKRISHVFAWGSLSFAFLAFAGISLWIRFHPGDL
jgi:hypothetical protein